ncbi:MAG TPA: hypothetical protein VKY27_10175 [Bacteriovoracaceae bacterium]|nr:hypothetical protein [Bacteriovoracaceae bacterium]
MNPSEISKDQINPHRKKTIPKTQEEHHTPEDEVRENELASLQDDSYAFDSDNTGIEEYHDVDDAVEVREEDDYLQ